MVPASALEAADAFRTLARLAERAGLAPDERIELVDRTVVALDRASSDAAEQDDALAEALTSARTTVDAWRHALARFDVQTREAVRAAIAPSYESLARSLRDRGASVPSLRPTNFKRSFYHALNAGVGIAIVALLPWRWGVVALAAFPFTAAWIMETGRRVDPRWNEHLMRFFGPIAHAHEARQVNSATWFATASFLLACVFPKLACVAAMAVLGAGDPVAGWVGRRFGRIKIARDRSLEGFAGFVAAGFVAAFAALVLVGGTQALGSHALIALVAALAGAIAESFLPVPDDNFSVPVVAAVAAALVAI